MNAFNRAVTVICLLLVTISAQAVFLTSNTIVNPTVIDFDSQPVVEDATGPIQIGTSVGLDIEFSGVPNNELFINPDSWGLVDNGEWSSGMTFLATDSARPGSMIIAFNSGPVSAVGAFMNYCPNGSCAAVGDLVISALDNSMGVLETYNVTDLADIVTPAAINGGAFRGIARPSADIFYFEITTVLPVMDDLTFTGLSVEPPPQSAPATPIPTMSEWALIMLLMLIGFTVIAKRKCLF